MRNSRVNRPPEEAGFESVAASADALALIMLGHNDVKLYDASLSEWAKDPALPMETGT